MNWHCPDCGESYYTDGCQFTTTAYYPPIIKDGVNINPDRNIRSCTRTCLACGNRHYVSNRTIPPQLPPGIEVPQS